MYCVLFYLMRVANVLKEDLASLHVLVLSDS